MEEMMAAEAEVAQAAPWVAVVTGVDRMVKGRLVALMGVKASQVDAADRTVARVAAMAEVKAAAHGSRNHPLRSLLCMHNQSCPECLSTAPIHGNYAFPRCIRQCQCN